MNHIIKKTNDWAHTYRKMLVDDVIAFWSKHAPDREHGGIFTYLDRDGELLSTDKAVWLQGRAVWIYAHLYNVLEPKPLWLELSNSTLGFLERYCFDSDDRMFFSVTRDGKPLRKRRYMFSETFAIIAYAENAVANGDNQKLLRAIEIFRNVVRRHYNPDETTPPKVDPSTRNMKSHSMPMILLATARSLREACVTLAPENEAINECNKVIRSAATEVQHDFYKPDIHLLLESVATDGVMLDTPEGRVVNPGHAIETSWFLLEEARQQNDLNLQDLALAILTDSLNAGWDDKHGGILYFIDAKGLPPDPMEHDMKLWWPHCEAMYATLLAYNMTGDKFLLDWHERVRDWTLSHFPDPDSGEWFGYLNRDGSPSKLIKGNMWKGPFHIPRALLKLYQSSTPPA